MKSLAALGLPPKRRARQPAVRLKVFVGYGDLTAFRRAMSAIGEGVRSRAQRADLEPRLWRFDQLTDAHWRDRSIEAALGADIVVLASSSPEATGPDIDSWIAHYLRASAGRRATLIVITGESDAWTISLEASAEPQAVAAQGACELVA